MNFVLPIPQLQKALLNWYREQARDLPWRRTKDPYHIWVSEVMLQQTQVDTVIGYYERFIERFPTVQALAEADVEAVLDAWAGLGYYRRARYLHAAAREIAEQYDGVVPEEPEAFGSLPGVGPYTTGAVISIAYDRPVPAVDGNVQRVLARLAAISDPVDRAAGKKKINALAAQLVPSDTPGEWNQAVMELGALVCRPQSPRCGDCPLAAWCRAAEEATAEAFPVTSVRADVRVVERLVGLVEVAGRIYLCKRPETGLLAGLWDFPAVEGSPDTWNLPGEREAALAASLEASGFGNVKVHAALGTDTHRFSHVAWNMWVYGCVADEGPKGPTWRAVAWEEAHELIVARAMRRALDVAARSGWPESR